MTAESLRKGCSNSKFQQKRPNLFSILYMIDPYSTIRLMDKERLYTYTGNGSPLAVLV